VNFKIKNWLVFLHLAVLSTLAFAQDDRVYDSSLIKTPEDGSTERLEAKINRERQRTEKKHSLAETFKGSRPELQADDPIVFDEDTAIMHATTNAKISDSNFEIDAQEIQFAQKTNTAKLLNDVRMTQERLRLVTNQADVNIKDTAFDATDVRLGSYPMFVAAKNLKANRNLVELKDASLYINEPAFASISANASEISYNSETDRLEMEDIVFKVGKVPFLYLPSYGQDGLATPPFYFELQYGYNGDFGFFGRHDIYYNAFDEASIGMLFDFYTERSVLFGPATDYRYAGANTTLRGSLRTGYIYDTGDAEQLDVDVLDRAITNRNRGFVDWRHKQTVFEDLELTGVVNWWRDSETLRDFRPRDFYKNQVPDNFVEAVYYGDIYQASVFTRFAPNDWVQTQERLPEARFYMQPNDILNLGIYQNFYADLAYLREDDILGYSDTLTSTRADAYYGLQMPIAATKWLTISPVIGARVTYYNDSATSEDQYVRMLGQIGFDAQMNIWGTYDIKSETLDLDGLRHNLRPVMMYRYIPSASQGQNRIPQIDRDVFTAYPTMLDLGMMRSTDELYDINTLRVGIENVFMTRNEGYGSRRIADLNFYQDFNFEKRPMRATPYANYKENFFSDFYAGGNLYPAKWLALGLYSRIDPSNGHINEIDTYVRLFDADAASLWLGTAYMDGQISQYWARVDYKLTENYRLRARWAYDARLSLFSEQIYSLWTRLGNSWSIEYMIAMRSGSNRENGFSCGVRVGLITF